MNLDEKRSLRLLRKIKSYRGIVYEESIIKIETEEEIERTEKKKERLEREITNTVNRLFPSIIHTILKDVTKHRMDFYLHDVPKMLMNEKFDGILMTRKSGVQFYCLGTEDEKAHFMYYMKTANFVRLYEVQGGEVKKSIKASQALALYDRYEKEHEQSEAN
jgi:hypothetical protein